MRKYALHTLARLLSYALNYSPKNNCGIDPRIISYSLRALRQILLKRDIASKAVWANPTMNFYVVSGGVRVVSCSWHRVFPESMMPVEKKKKLKKNLKANLI